MLYGRDSLETREGTHFQDFGGGLKSLTPPRNRLGILTDI
jgi:hypothetical protein